MSEQNKDVVVKFIQAMGANDGGTAAQFLAPDAFALAMGFSKLGGVRNAGMIIGVVEAFKKVVPTGLRPTIQTVIAEGEKVVVEFEGDAVTCEGKPYCNQYCMVFTMQDGKVKEVHEYFCTKLADEVLYPAVAAMEQQQEGGTESLKKPF